MIFSYFQLSPYTERPTLNPTSNSEFILTLSSILQDSVIAQSRQSLTRVSNAFNFVLSTDDVGDIWREGI